MKKYTGLQEFTRLEEYNLDTGVATGNYKINNPSDEEYVPPRISLSCPNYFTKYIGDQFICEVDENLSSDFKIDFTLDFLS